MAAVLTDPATSWQRVTVSGWYGNSERTVEISSAIAVWRHGGMPVVPIRWVLIRDPLGKLDTQALLCTDLVQDPVQVLRWFVQRWQVEDSFETAKNELGLDHNETRSWHGWHRHVSLVMLAFAMMASIRHRANQPAPQNTTAPAPDPDTPDPDTSDPGTTDLVRWSVQEIRRIATRLAQRRIQPAHVIA